MSADPTTPRLPPVSEVFPDEGQQKAAAAAEAGDVAQVRALAASRANLDALAPSGGNLLMYEIAAQHETAVRTLLDAGADPNVLTPTGSSPMLFAGIMEDPLWIGLLLDKGGDPNLKNQTGEPLLTILVQYQRWSQMLLLLDHGARIDETGPLGQTATFRLGALHQFDRVYAMLERGADPTLVDVHGLSLHAFVKQPVPPGSPQEPWRERVAERIGAA